MKYKLTFDAKALKALGKLDKPIAKRISSWLKENLANCENPRQFGEPLVGDMKGFWKYRIGDYRILADINDGIKIIEIVRVDHRKQVYNY